MRVFETVSTVDFPAPAGRNVNMMPFVLGDPASLPETLRPYQPLVEACGIEPDELGRVGYLTVTETRVHPGTSQRRGGVHVERHPSAGWGGGGWGGGRHAGRRHGGLYLASTMADTTAVWPVAVPDPGPGGDCEDRRDQLRQAHRLGAGELVWLTDTCPHESLPVPQSGVRQFFRVVTSAVDLWYQDHSTANPLGITPPEHVTVVTGSKFDH